MQRKTEQTELLLRNTVEADQLIGCRFDHQKQGAGGELKTKEKTSGLIVQYEKAENRKYYQKKTM